TLHLRKIPFAGLSSALFPPLATAVRARCKRTADTGRAQSNEVESRRPVCRSPVTSSSGAGLTRRRSRVRVLSLSEDPQIAISIAARGTNDLGFRGSRAYPARESRKERVVAGNPAGVSPVATSGVHVRCQRGQHGSCLTGRSAQAYEPGSALNKGVARVAA